VRRILNELPEGLDETYERILREIGKPNQKHAYRLLQCLVAADHPLRVEELAEVVAVDFDSEGTPMLNPGWRWSDQQEAVLSACSSLVMIVKESDWWIVQISHFSVKEFLLSSRLAESSKDVSWYHIQLEPAHTIFAQACLGVLLGLDDGVDRDSIGSFPLARYAAQYWVKHARFGNVSSRIADGMDCLFDADRRHFATWLWIYNQDRYESLSTMRPSKPEAVPLYYAALHGFRDLAERLLARHPGDLNAEGGNFQTPLSASFYGRHPDIFALFVDNLPAADIRIKNGFTPLHMAAGFGQLEVGQRLLSHGADVNAQTNSTQTPLQIAAALGHLEFARMLLEHEALVNVPADDGETPLHRASRNGCVEIARLLLENGADRSARNNEGITPFELASNFRQQEIMRILTEYGDGSLGEYIVPSAFPCVVEELDK
jgi:ankyrin repeat protein